MYRVSKQALAGRTGAPATPDNPTAAQQQAVIRAALDLAAAERPARDQLVDDARAATEEARTLRASSTISSRCRKARCA
jgi:hypothetical protein